MTFTRTRCALFRSEGEAMTQQFEPFQKILVRDRDRDYWRCGFFSHMREKTSFKYVSTEGIWEQCIPYEGNEHLVGTSNSPTPPEPEQKFVFGDKVEVSDDFSNWYRAIYLFHRQEQGFPHAAIREEKSTPAFWKHCRKADW